MSLQKIPLKKDSLTPETLEAAEEAKQLAALKPHFPRESDAQLRERLPKPVHLCDAPKVTTADNMAPGSVFICDTCGRKKELIYFSWPNPYDESGDSRWAWRNLPHPADQQPGGIRGEP